jgi:lipopolysaccharide heptosyltransferase I
VSDRAPRFLIVRLGSLGDVVHAIPAVAALIDQHADARVDWIVEPRYVDLVKAIERIGTVIPFDTRQGWGSLVRTARRLRGERYEAVVDLQGLIKSAVLARVAGARRTIGFTSPHLRERFASVLYTETHDPGDVVHVIDKGLALMRALGVQDTTVKFPLNVPPRVRPDGYVLINPGAAWPNKRWPPDRFGALAAAIRERHGLLSVVLWGPGEERAAADVVAASRGAAEQAPRTSITDILALAQGASLMVSGDTGPLHLAAAVGTPIVALFGPTRSERNGPWSPADISLSRFDTCVCHYERRCRRGQPCLDDIAIEAVVAAVERRVAARR